MLKLSSDKKIKKQTSNCKTINISQIYVIYRHSTTSSHCDYWLPYTRRWTWLQRARCVRSYTDESFVIPITTRDFFCSSLYELITIPQYRLTNPLLYCGYPVHQPLPGSTKVKNGDTVSRWWFSTWRLIPLTTNWNGSYLDFLLHRQCRSTVGYLNLKIKGYFKPPYLQNISTKN